MTDQAPENPALLEAVLEAAGGGEPAVLYLAIELSLPLEGFQDYVRRLAELAAVPGLPNGFMVVPMTHELKPGADRFGALVLRR
ncbi:MAG: hypothetical protein HY748_09655 [Elusimicrobia bacterium]|nr:hypothetical protein [Elusimicrobiota bacterium]